jgi:hypothetical protein
MLVPVVDTHCCQDGDDDIIVGKVCVEGTAKWKVGCVVCNGAVDAAIAVKYVLIVEAGEKFLEVAQSLSTTSRVAVAIVVYANVSRCLVRFFDNMCLQ